ncbi:Hypothetical protein FKW44_016810, partial [Caligus rogercresseyi]
ICSSVYVFSDEEMPSEDNDVFLVVHPEVEVDFENDESVIAPDIPKDDEGGEEVKRGEAAEGKEPELKVLDSSESVITPDSELK